MGEAWERNECALARVTVTGFEYLFVAQLFASVLLAVIFLLLAPGHESIHAALGNADRALYEAKQAGRNRVEVHKPESRTVTAPQAEAGLGKPCQ
jgi:hypothetical protein